MVKARRAAREFTRTIIPLPDRPLSDSIIDLAAPLLNMLPLPRDPDETRQVLRQAIEIWNLHVMAGPVWRKPDGLAAARARLLSPGVSPEQRSVFELLSERRTARFRDDPRCVGKWSFERSAITPGQHDLVCESLLPRGTEPEVAPPIALRVGIGGRWLDDIAMRLTATSYVSFPVHRHHAELDEDGAVVVHTRARTVVQLFAMGLLSPICGAPVAITVQGRTLATMVLVEVRGTPEIGDDGIVLRFEPGIRQADLDPRG